MRKLDRVEGPRGWFELSNDEKKLYVVVDIKSLRTQHIVEKILNDPKYTLTNDGEYCFWLDLTDRFRAMQLIGKRPDRRG